MMRRVELRWPVNDPALRQQIIADEVGLAHLHDDRDAWTQPPMVYQRAPHPRQGGARNALMGAMAPAASAA